MKITPENYDEVKAALTDFLEKQIDGYLSNHFGDTKRMSIRLGNSISRVEMVRRRKTFTSMERLWRDCRKKFGKI